MSEHTDPPALPLCPSADLQEGGLAVPFDVLYHGPHCRAFAIRVEGRVHAYLNRCAHVPVEMDWQPGAFLDSDKRFIICSVHGASYEPAHGRCVGGPCGRSKLIAIDVAERDGQACWYPSRDVRPAPPAAPLPSPSVSPP